MITKPMLAGTIKDLKEIRYPVLCTPKLDGIRALKIDGKLVSRNFKPIPNNYIRELIESQLPDGVDGELICTGKSFQETTSAMMSEAGQPQVDYYIFDWVPPGKDMVYDSWLSVPYRERMENLKRLLNIPPWVIKLLPTQIDNERCLLAYEERMLAEGYEGVMLRSPSGPYKEGRSTVKEHYLLKLKRFSDSEAVVVAFDERMHNANVETKDAFGHAEHSTHRAGMIPMGTLGALVVREGKMDFKIGSGFTDEQRQEVWNNREKYLGKLVKYKSQKQGSKDAPRFPIFLAFRDERDM